MKKLSKVLAIIVAGALLVGCGASKSVEIDANSLATSLVESLTFGEDLEQMNDKLVEINFELPEGTEAIVYQSAGYTSDICAVFTAQDATAAGKTLETVKAYVAETAESFQDYAPEETERADNAIFVQNGKYVVVVISSEQDKAQTMIDEAFAK